MTRQPRPEANHPSIHANRVDRQPATDSQHHAAYHVFHRNATKRLRFCLVPSCRPFRQSAIRGIGLAGQNGAEARLLLDAPAGAAPHMNKSFLLLSL